MYIGIEAEGELKGLLTLFIDDKTMSADSILEILAKHPEIQHVYFGARGKYGISEEHIKLVEDICDVGMQVTIEINILDSLPDIPYHENLRIVLAVRVKDVSNIHKHNIYVKIEDTKELFIFENQSHTSLDSILYKLDKEMT